MTRDFNLWINKRGPQFFKKVGIKPGQKILDFGSGWGSNTVAILKIVAPEGYVYAFEKNDESIKKLLEVADGKKMKNLKIIQAESKTETPVGDKEMDGALLYDVIHDDYFSRSERRKLFGEMRRIIKEGGLLSVFPHHITGKDFKKIKKDILDSGFKYKDRIMDSILHDSILIKDTIYNFIRE